MEIHRWELWPGIDVDKEGSQTVGEPNPKSPYLSLAFSCGCTGLCVVTQIHPQVLSDRTLINIHILGSTQSALKVAEHQPKGEVN